MSWQDLHGWFTKTSLVRRAAEALLRAGGRRHLARFDRQTAARCQSRILLGLLHQAQTTRFGLDHDFRRIRGIADFRRLVPLTTRADLWRQYWQPVYPHLAGATWPKPGRSLQAAHRDALRTALALVADAQPRTPLLAGEMLFLGDEGPSSQMRRDNLPERLPALARPYARTTAERPAEYWAERSITCLAGSVERLVPLLERVKQVRGKDCLLDVWPGLTAILYTRRTQGAPVDRLRAEAEGVSQLEMVGRAEGPIAVDDPRYGLPRLLHDHGVYFEFVPPGQASELRCPRFGIDEVEVGVPYELAVTSPAGLWACRIGRIVCLERRDPPLVRFLDPQPAKPVDTRITLPLHAPHPQIGGSPAAPPESSFHSPWSARVDRE